MVAILLFVSLILFLLLSIPIGVSLGLASLTTIRTMDCISMTTFVQSMIQGLNSFPLMAVPLFTFAGEVMGKGGEGIHRPVYRRIGHCDYCHIPVLRRYRGHRLCGRGSHRTYHDSGHGEEWL